MGPGHGLINTPVRGYLDLHAMMLVAIIGVLFSAQLWRDTAERPK